jgi:hypothetical protein
LLVPRWLLHPLLLQAPCVSTAAVPIMHLQECRPHPHPKLPQRKPMLLLVWQRLEVLLLLLSGPP